MYKEGGQGALPLIAVLNQAARIPNRHSGQLESRNVTIHFFLKERLIRIDQNGICFDCDIETAATAYVITDGLARN